jgi:uncharacterized protein YqjF (DUF2071 family)
MGQSWRHLLFAHWRVDAAELERLIPPQIRLDLHQGDAWVAVTPFRVEGFRLRGTPPAPVLSRFSEVNVRTYVECAGKPGIFFLSLDTNSRSAVAGARRTYRLPYFRASQSLTDEAGDIRFRSARTSPDGPAAELRCSYRSTGEQFQATPGTLEHWLTERYCLYTLAGNTVHRAEIHHPPWPLQSATADFETNSMTAGLGLELAGDPLLHYSALQDVVLWSIEPV